MKVETLFKYNREAMLAAVLYILDKLGKADWHLVHKTFYIADKKSIADHGQSISGNTYIRMPYGPVPSELDYLLEALREKGAHTTYFGVPVTDLLRVEGKCELIGLRKTGLKYLSKTDRECLDYAIDICKGLDFEQRTLLTHDYAWKQAKKNGVAMRWEDIAVAGGGGEESLEYFNDLKDSQANLFPSS
jgi:hypothetical protein